MLATALLLSTACKTGNEDPRRLNVMVVFPPKDTVRFELPATLQRCRDRRAVLIQSVIPEGSGVLAYLRYRDSLTSDSFPVLALGDSITTPGAIVSVRYLIREVAHAFIMDEGAVVVDARGSSLHARIAGSGLENTIRTPIRMEYHDVPLGSDTVPCGYQP